MDDAYEKALHDAVAAVRSVYSRTDSGEILRQGGDWENALDRAITAIEAVAATPAGYTRCRAGCPLTRREENATAPFKEKVSA